MSEFPKDENGNPTHHSCIYCGYVWQHGQHGGHDCKGNLKAAFERVAALYRIERATGWGDDIDTPRRLAYDAETEANLKTAMTPV
jgi:hypothetical protein